MPSYSDQHDIGARLSVASAVNAAEVTAGTTTEDGIEVNGKIVDRWSTSLFSDKRNPMSAKVLLTYDAALTATTAGTNTASLTFNLQHSSSTATGDFTDYDDKDGSTANSASATTASAAGEASADFDLGSAKRYVRLQVTPAVSGTTTGDTIDYGGVFVFGGFDQYPAP